MKTRKLFSLGLALLLAVTFTACNEDYLGEDISIPNSSSINVVKGTTPSSDFSMRTVRNRLNQLGVGAHFAASFASASSSKGRTSGGPMTALVDQSNARTSAEACFTETFTEFDDGSYQWVAEFLGGCEIDGEALTGIIRGSGKYEGNTFTDTLVFENLSDGSFTINGTEINSGTFENDDDEEWYEETGTYTYSNSFEILETYEGETYTYNFVSSGNETFSGASFIINSYSERSEGSDGELYLNEVISPIVIDFQCDVSEEYWIPVSGVETSQWSYQDETWSESIDFGDGSCDPMASITENGETIEVDLTEDYDACEECDDEDESGDDEEEGDEEDEDDEDEGDN